MTTSVNSSAHWGFSGGTRATIFGLAQGSVRYRSPVPEILEVERTGCWPRRPSNDRSSKAWMVEPATAGRHHAGPPRAALVGRSFTAARRRGKLMLSTPTGPTLGVGLGMTGGLVVDGNQALDRLQYGPGVLATSGCGPDSPSRTAALDLSTTPSIRFARAGAQREQARPRRSER